MADSISPDIEERDPNDPYNFFSAHTNAPLSTAPSLPASLVDADHPSHIHSTTSPQNHRSPKPDQSPNWSARTSSKAALASLRKSDKPSVPVAPGSMSSIPLHFVDYKQLATQPNRAREAAEAARTQGRTLLPAAPNQLGRTSSSTSSSLTTATIATTASTTGTRETPLESPLTKPFTERFGRRYLRDPTLPYLLPCDLPEIHRQTLRTLLLYQVFNGPLCSPAFEKKAPKRVLDFCCGSGLWSVMCHRHFARRGFNSIEFTGLDIAPLAPRMDVDDDINWRFVQHDILRLPLPFRDGEFNLIMTKDTSMVSPATDLQQRLMDELLRILKPGGTLEAWDGDHCLRMLLPQTVDTNDDDDSSEDEEQARSNTMGVYTLSPKSRLGSAQNQYIQDYNGWMLKVTEARQLMHMPCAQIRPLLLQESETLMDVGTRQVAIPLGEIRWEPEGVGGIMAQGSIGMGHTMSAAGKGKGKDADRRALTPGQAALRRTALETFVTMVESLEPVLREASGKDISEWDRWQESMMNDLLNHDGTSWGECLEVCAGWAQKKKPPTPPPS